MLNEHSLLVAGLNLPPGADLDADINADMDADMDAAGMAADVMVEIFHFQFCLVIPRILQLSIVSITQAWPGMLCEE